MLGNGDGTFKAPAFTNSPVFVLLASADLNGDGNADLLGTAGTSSGQYLQVLLGNGNGTFTALPASSIRPGSDVSLVDVNGDGKLDLVELITDLKTYWIAQVALGNGDGTFGTPATILHPPYAAVLLAADFNYDNRPDIVLGVSSTGGEPGELPAGITTILNTTAAPPGSDFSLSAGSTSSAAVMPGQTATYTLTVAPSGGFNQAVALSCSGAPALTSCSISPSSLQLNGTSSSTAMVTITTTAPSMGRMLPLSSNHPFLGPRLRLFPLGLVSLALIVMLLARRRNPQLRVATPFGFVALLLLAATLSSCGGGSSSSGTGGSSSPGTAAGTYTITVTGTAGSGSSAISHTTTLTLVVQ